MSIRTPINLYDTRLVQAPIYVGDFLHGFTDYKWDDRLRRRVVNEKYYYISPDTGLLYLPRYALEGFKDYVGRYNYSINIVDIKPVTGVDIKFNMKSTYRDKDQRQTFIIDRLINHDDGLRGVALQTGGGKTYIVIKAISLIGKRAAIGVSGMLEYWIKQMLEYTDLKPEDIYCIQGSDSILKLIKNIDRINPKIILYSIPTMRPYTKDKIPSDIIPSFDVFCSLCGIGVVVKDEAHTNFAANLIFDLRMNAYVNIPMTATFDVSSQKAKKVYDSFYPENIRFGSKMFNKYVTVHSYEFKADNIPRYAFMSRDGYSHVMYENYLLKRQGTLKYIYGKYKYILNKLYIHKREKGQKALVLCSTKEMCYHIKRELEKDFPDFKVATFVGGDKESVYLDNDIIVSTVKSSGTGKDIPNLLVVLNTVSIKSAPLNEQIKGRLRDIPGHQTILAYIFNGSLQSHKDHHSSRIIQYGPKCKQFLQFNI